MNADVMAALAEEQNAKTEKLPALDLSAAQNGEIGDPPAEADAPAAPADSTPGNSDIENDSDDGVPKLMEEEIPKWRAIMPVADMSDDFKKLVRRKHKKVKKRERAAKKKERPILPPIRMVRAGTTPEAVLASGRSVFDYSGTKHHSTDVIVGRQPPNFSGIDMEGRLRHLTEWTTNGRPTVICFYVPWSGPCAMQVPELDRHAKQFPVPVIPPGGVDFVLCSCDHAGTFDKGGLDLVREFNKVHGLSAPNVTHMVIEKDSTHKVHQYGVEYFPHLTLVHKDGVVLANYANFSWDLVTKAAVFSEVAREDRTLDRDQFQAVRQMLGYAPLSDWYLKIEWMRVMRSKWESRARADAAKAAAEAEAAKLQAGGGGSSHDGDGDDGDGKSLGDRLRAARTKLSALTALRAGATSDANGVAEAAAGAAQNSEGTERARALVLVDLEEMDDKRWIALDDRGLLDGFDILQMLAYDLPTTKLKEPTPVDPVTLSYYKEIDKHRRFWECEVCEHRNQDMKAFACAMCGIKKPGENA
jgi:hypothetical protein